MKAEEALTGLDGKALTAKEERQWRKDQAKKLLEEQKTGNPTLDAWNTHYNKPRRSK